MQSNLDILIPVSIDHEDRLRNLNIVLNYLSKAKFTNIFIREYYNDNPKTEHLKKQYSNYNFSFMPKPYNYFNKMSCINELFLISKGHTKNTVACWYDVDVLVNKKSLITATQMLEDKRYDIVYPYDGNFFDIPANTVKSLVTDLNTPIELKTCTLFNKSSWGGCAVFLKESFVAGGMCNPNFKNVGYDDDEFLMRFRRLGFKIGRTNGVLLHLNHFRGNTSFNFNDYTQNNINEVTKVTHMPLEDLKQYIKSW